MKTILAAVDNSIAGTPVIASARSLASLLGADVRVAHVKTNGDLTAQSTAQAFGLPLRTLRGPVVDSLVAAGAVDDVIALAIGARGTTVGRSLGGTAAAVATSVLKPVLVVPPEAEPPATFARVLVPLEGTLSTSLAPRSIFELARSANVEAVALHVLDRESIPSFTDQPQHEHVAWAKEFVARYCAGLELAGLETRVGRSSELVARVAEERSCDLIALGWSQELGPGRAEVVRGTLERTSLPVLLVPVRVVHDAGPDVGQPLGMFDRKG